MSYTIIGCDSRQYGPIGEDEVRLWIAEGRLNAQSMAKLESDAEFRPLSAFPEFAAALPREASPPASVPPVLASPAELLERDYDLDMGGCIAAGWKLVFSNFWPCVGVTFLVMLVMGVLNQGPGLFTRPVMHQMIYEHHFSGRGVFFVGLVSFLAAPIYTVLISGLYMYFLKLIRGQSATVADAFSGFGPSLGQLILLGWVQAGLIWLGFACCIIPGVYLAVAWCFVVPLVVDRQMGFWNAMELSRRMAGKHWFLVLGFLIVNGLLMMAGVIACCVGLFVTIPIGMAALMCAYERIFSQTQNPQP